MNLLNVITLAGGRIGGGSEYLWNCFGNNARYLEFQDTTGYGYSHCIFDTKTYEVYEIHVDVNGQQQAFLWTNDKYKKAYLKEAKEREVNANIAWDDVKYAHVSENNILTYLKDVGELYYDNLPSPKKAKIKTPRKKLK
jgi:hypothetical protein